MEWFQSTTVDSAVQVGGVGSDELNMSNYTDCVFLNRETSKSPCAHLTHSSVNSSSIANNFKLGEFSSFFMSNAHQSPCVLLSLFLLPISTIQMGYTSANEIVKVESCELSEQRAQRVSRELFSLSSTKNWRWKLFSFYVPHHKNTIFHLKKIVIFNLSWLCWLFRKLGGRFKNFSNSIERRRRKTHLTTRKLWGSLTTICDRIVS